MNNRTTFLRRMWRGLGPALILAALQCAPVTAAPNGHRNNLRPRLPSQVTRGTGKSPVSLNVDRAPIKAVLHLLFREADQSYVLGPHVSGTVTASFHHIPFDTALTQILSVNSVHLTKRLVNGVYVITGPRIARHRAATTRRTTTRRTTVRRTPAPVARSYRRRPGYYRRRSTYRPGYYRRRPAPRPYTVPGAGGVHIIR